MVSAAAAPVVSDTSSRPHVPLRVSIEPPRSVYSRDTGVFLSLLTSVRQVPWTTHHEEVALFLLILDISGINSGVRQ